MYLGKNKRNENLFPTQKPEGSCLFSVEKETSQIPDTSPLRILKKSALRLLDQKTNKQTNKT